MLESIVNNFTTREESDTEGNASRLSKPPRIFLPDVFARWPWPRRINPHYAVVMEESDAWMASLQPFSPRLKDVVDGVKVSLLAALAHPTTGKKHVRATSDLLYLTLIVDEFSESPNTSLSEVRKQTDVVLDAIRNPDKPRPNEEWIGGEAARQFWAINMQNVTEIAKERFVRNMTDFLNAVVLQCVNREQRHGCNLDIESFINLRRKSAGVGPFLSMIELDYDIPDEVMSLPAIQGMILATTDIVALYNDMCSYNVEQMCGHQHNTVVCIMNEFHTDVNGAMLWLEHYLLEACDRFLSLKASLPKWEEPLNTQVQEYCDGLGQWVRANEAWHFECERYFGTKGLEIKKNKWMSLLPKKPVGNDIGPTYVDGSLMLH